MGLNIFVINISWIAKDINLNFEVIQTSSESVKIFSLEIFRLYTVFFIEM